jgi:hypothetical protein
MHIARHALTAGLMAVSLGVCSAPAVAKGGGDGAGDANNTVVTFAPDAPAPVTNGGGSGGSGGGGGGGGGGRALRCSPSGEVQPGTGAVIMICTSARA